MLGAIIPEPLHIPPIRTVLPLVSVVSTANSLGYVSVVIIASAAFLEAVGELSSLRRASVMSLLMMGRGSWRPMIPVEATATSSGRMFRPWATWWVISLASSMPFSPVKQLALPLLATIADSFPFLTDSLVMIIGAACTLFLVNTAAALLCG